MIDKEIVENNKLIAEFLGAEIEQWYPATEEDPNYGKHVAYPQGTKYPDLMRYHSLKNLKYHLSWDWLMPIVETISNLPNINVNISSFDGCVIYDDDYKNTAKGIRINKVGDLINSTYSAVVDFIKFYNKIK